MRQNLPVPANPGSGLIPGVIFCLVFGLSLTNAAQAQTRTSLGIYGDWGEYRDPASGVCYALTVPQRSTLSRSSARRGDAYLAVTYGRGADTGRSAAQPYWRAGFPIDGDTPVALRIDSRAFELAARQEEAWASSSAADTSILAAMRLGQIATVRSVSTRGTVVTDSYSLKGFSAAMDAARTRCS